LERAPRYGQRVDQTARRGCRAQSEETEVSVLTGGPEGHSAAHVFAADCDAHEPKRESGACFASLQPQAAAGMPASDRGRATASRGAPVSNLVRGRRRSGGSVPDRMVRRVPPEPARRWPKPASSGRGRRAAGRPTTPSLGFVPLSTTRTRAIVTSVCLTDAIRPQGFPPSRRFDPARASWVCFTPLPPIGFWPSELFPRGQL